MHDIEHPLHESPVADEAAPSNEVPLWMPDLLGWLCEQLEPDVAIIEALALFDWVGEEGVDHLNGLRKAIQQTTDGNAPPLLLEYASGCGLGMAPEFMLKAQLLAAVAIDDACLKLVRDEKGQTAQMPRVLDPIRLEYVTTGNCARHPDYVVVPAERRGKKRLQSGTSLSRHFQNVRVMTRRRLAPWTLNTVLVQPGFGRFNGLAIQAMHEGDPRVFVVPLAQSRSDVTVEAVPEARVTISPSTSQEARLITRAGEGIRRAVREGAHIVVFPEWVVSPAVVAAIRKTLRSLTPDERDHLQLVIAGTGLMTTAPTSGLLHAECLVFDSAGVELWRQGKMHPWTMGAEAQRAAGLGEVKHDGRQEHFHPSNVMCVAETPVGRCVILICEDLEQDKPGRDVVGYLNPRWIFSPVLDVPLEVHRWAAMRGYDLAKKFSATVIVANSLTLGFPIYAGASDDGVPATTPYGVLFSFQEPREVMVASIPTADLPPQEEPLVGRMTFQELSTLDIRLK